MLQFGLEPFAVNCINPRKTVCDKISRLVKLSYRDNPIDEFSKHIRDLYDLHAILSVKEYKDFLNSDEFLEALYRTTLEDQLMKNSKTDNPLDKAIIFNDTKNILSNPTIKKAYYNGLGSLFFANEKMPDLSEIQKTIMDIGKRVVFFENYRNVRNNNSADIKKNEFTSISIYPSRNGEKSFIRYKVNGEQVLGTELDIRDKIYYEKISKEGTNEEIETARVNLAEKYYLKEMNNVVKRTDGIHR